MSQKNKSKKSAVRKQGAKEFVSTKIKQVPTAAKAAGHILMTVPSLVSAGSSGKLSAIGGGLSTAGHLQEAKKAIAKGVKQDVQALKGLGKMLFNHPEWYMGYDLEHFINLNYGRRKTGSEPISANSRTANVPSVVGVLFELIRPRDDANSFTQAVNILYNKVRSANSGAINFTRQDLEHYIITVRSIRALFAFMRRIASTQNNVSVYDATIPDALLTIQGITSPSDVYGNNGNLKLYLSGVARRITALCPLSMPILDRTDWLLSNYFTDSDDIKASYFVYYFNYLPYYDTANTTSYTNMVITKTVDGLRANMETLLATFDKVPVFNIIAGDLLKAYGVNALYHEANWGMDERTPVIYDEAALTQLQNATILGISNEDDSPILIKFDGTFTIPSIRAGAFNTGAIPFGPTTDYQYVNTYKDSMSPAETIAATRFKFVVGSAQYNSDGTAQVNGIKCGSEIIRGLYYINPSTGTPTTFIGSYDAQEIINTPTAGAISVWSAMDWSPMMKILDPSTLGAQPYGVLWDWNNYALISRTEIDQLNQLATLSLFKHNGDVSRSAQYDALNVNI